LIYFMAIWNVLRTFGILYDHLVHFCAHLVHFCAHLVHFHAPRKIWQPCSKVELGKTYVYRVCARSAAHRNLKTRSLKVNTNSEKVPKVWSFHGTVFYICIVLGCSYLGDFPPFCFYFPWFNSTSIFPISMVLPALWLWLCNRFVCCCLTSVFRLTNVREKKLVVKNYWTILEWNPH
jgi:hypothetical protein